MGLLLEYTIMLLIVLFWILLGSLRPAASAVVPETTTVGNVSTIPPPKSVPEIEKEIEALVGSISKMALPYFVRNSDLKLSPSCMSTFFKIFVDIRKLKFPVVKLLDAMAKPPFGIMEGTFIVMGDYDECLEVSSSKKGDVPMTKEEEYYHGQYCTIEASLPPKLDEAIRDYGSGKLNLSFFGKLAPFIKELPVNFRRFAKFRIGVCLPSTCTKEDLTEILGLNPLSFLPVNVSRCEDGQKKPLNADQMVFFVVIALFTVLILSGTALDAWLHIKYTTYKGDHKDKFIKLLVAFSIYSNTKKLVTPSKKSGGEIPVVNGMYVMGTVLVIIYHTYFQPFLTIYSSHVTNVGTYLDDFFFTLIAVMGISIEAYFLFSGMFLVYPRFRRGEKTVKVNMIKLIVRRYIRLGPSMLIILGIIVVLPVIGSGPVWEDIFGKAAENTRKWWYTYVLMYNNFLEVKDQNFLYLWFIPCLMQISIIGAILLWVMGKNVKVGMCLTVAAGLACNIALGVLTALRHYPAAYSIYYYYDREYFEETIYTAPLSHVFSFGIGMILGYFMAKNPILKWSKVHVILGWIVSLFLTVGVQFIAYVWHEGREPDPIAAAIYAATHRTAFSLGLSWIILACTHGYGGVVGKVLCWKGFGSLSKLGYFGYLIHYIVLTYHISVARSPLVYSHHEVLMRISGYTLLTFIAAYILYITFELPLVYIESLFLPSRRPDSAVENNNIQHNGKSNDVSIVRYNGDVLPPNIAKPVWNGNTVTSPTYVENDSSVEHSKL